MSNAVTRFAPSPTGHLHIGGARTALFCWAFAKKLGGRFMIRIEDTDQARSSEASARGILEDLAWLGLEWDDGPALDWHNRTIGGQSRDVGSYYQSKRLPIYNKVVDDMIERGIAYADFTPESELKALRAAAQAANQTFRFHPPADKILSVPHQRERIAKGEPHVVRFRAREEAVSVVDQVLGEVSFSASEVDDFVLRKADGFPTYHFGVVVDDEHMGVTHVLRGQEHLMNTPKHVALQKALGYRTPMYAHMPLIFNDAGAKMSKRERDQTARKAMKDRNITASPVPEIIDNASFSAWLGDTKRQLETGQLEALAAQQSLALPEVSVDDFRRAGYLPGVICNFIALLGWNPGENIEKFDMDFLAKNFNVERIGKSNARFDRKKLLSFNADAIAKLSDEQFLSELRAWAATHAPAELNAFLAGPSATLLAKTFRPRTKTLRDIIAATRFLFTADASYPFDRAAVDKNLLANSNAGLDHLRRMAADFAQLTDAAWTVERLSAYFEEVVAAHKLANAGVLAQPLRVALTGTTVSPGIAETLVLLGRQRSIIRIQRCLLECKG
ncbi:MAG: glutamate--tRNA ligase [Planctomycetota bacterium]|nr:glutamate--tRNA ligase [Planctomycetota bacterium]